MHSDGDARRSGVGVDIGGDAEVFQVAARVLTGLALRGLALSAGSMPLPQFRMLAVLDESGRCTAGQVARTLRLAEPSVARLADRLAASGHLVRSTHPYNHAVTTLELTPAGRDLVARVMHWRHQELTRILARLSPPRRLAAAQAIRGLIEAAAGAGYGADHITGAARL